MKTEDVLYADRNVRILALDVVGLIERKTFGDGGLKYHVAYYWNGERKIAKCLRRELEPTDDPVGHGGRK